MFINSNDFLKNKIFIILGTNTIINTSIINLVLLSVLINEDK